jgi:DNA modification methylase
MKTLKDYEYYRTDNGVLYCGDCLEILPLIDEKVDLVITSPPYYNSGKKYQRGTGFHYDIDVGEPMYIIFDCLELLNKKVNNCICFNLSFSYGETGIMRPYDIINRVRNKIGYFVNDLIVWHKDNPIPLNNRLTNAYEPIFVLSNSPQIKYYNNGYTHNVINNPVSSGIKGHSATFPVEIPEKLTTFFSKENDLILDTFLGSGTTAVACERLNRRWIGIEISEKYCEIAKKRIEQEYNQIKMF